MLNHTLFNVPRRLLNVPKRLLLKTKPRGLAHNIGRTLGRQSGALTNARDLNGDLAL